MHNTEFVIQFIMTIITNANSFLIDIERSLFSRAVAAEYLSAVTAVMTSYSHTEPLLTVDAVRDVAVLCPLPS